MRFLAAECAVNIGGRPGRGSTAKLKYQSHLWRFPIPIGTKCGKYGDSAQTLVRPVKGASAAPYRLGVFPISIGLDLLVMSQREILQGSESLTNASPMQTKTHGDSRCRWKQGKRMKSGPLCEALTVPNKDSCAVPGTYKLEESRENARLLGHQASVWGFAGCIYSNWDWKPP